MSKQLIKTLITQLSNDEIDQANITLAELWQDLGETEQKQLIAAIYNDTSIDWLIAKLVETEEQDIKHKPKPEKWFEGMTRILKQV